MLSESEHPEGFTLLHRGPGGPANQLSKVTDLRGEVEPRGIAARGQTLWMIYTDGTMQSIRAEPTPLKDGWMYQRRVQPSLPAGVPGVSGVAVRAVAVTDAGPWVLVRVDDAQMLDLIEGAAKPKASAIQHDPTQRRRNLALGLPLNYQSPNAAQPTDTEPVKSTRGVQPQDQARPSATVSFPVDRLLFLEHGRWRVQPLPTDWPHAAQAWLVSDTSRAKHPTLVALTAESDAPTVGRIDVYRWQTTQDPAWVSESYAVEMSGDDVKFQIVDVENQLVLAELIQEDTGPSALLRVLRAGKALPIGRVSLRGQGLQAPSVLSYNSAVALTAQRPVAESADTPRSDSGLTWTQMDLRGNVLLDQTDLTIRTRGPMDDIVQYVGVVFVVVLASVLMMAFWRRDADWNRLALPDDLVVADLAKRVMAAGIDLAPGLLGVMFYFGLSIDELTYRWPGNGLAKTIDQMLPGALVIFFFVSHTTLSELIFARTLGKALTGLRAVRLDGTPPRAWQRLVRGLMKVLDLLPFAWLLLVLPVIAPHRQRLGDLIARTVVVADAPEEESQDEDDQGDQDESDDSV
jgi:uncharacterized RDD family membrane protein YckC